MAEIILKTNKPDKASEIVKEVLEKEKLHIKRSLDLAESKLKSFEKKYKISSMEFINHWSAEDLQGGDMEYVEWAGEYRFFLTLNERLDALQSIKHAAP